MRRQHRAGSRRHWSRLAAWSVAWTCLGIGPGAVRAQIFVNAGASGVPDGQSWATAYTSLQDALDGAPPFSQLWVASGIYRPDTGATVLPGDRTAAFQIRDGIQVFGGFNGSESVLGQRDLDANPTLLSGDLLGNDLPAFVNNSDNSLHIIDGNGSQPGSLLDGFIIAGGNANGPAADGAGGGARIDGGSLLIANCLFVDNFAQTQGGAVFASNGANPTIQACSFEGNASGEGGAVSTVAGDSTLRDCSFTMNTAIIGTGSGGAVASTNGNLSFTRCSFVQNSALRGAAVYNGPGSSASGWNATFELNIAGDSGGAVYSEAAMLMLINCLVAQNEASGPGGGLYNLNVPSAEIINCTLVENMTASFGGGLANDNSGANLFNSILWANQDTNGAGEPAQIFLGPGGSAIVNYSIVDGGWSGPGTNNIPADPAFVGLPANEYGLAPGSPAIDAGDTTALPNDLVDVDDDGDLAEVLPLDLAGSARIIDDPAAPNTGVATPDGVVDIGCFEFAAGPALTRLYVDADAGGVPDGSSWPTAFPNPLDAMMAAKMLPTVTEIWVAEGTYKPDAAGGQQNVAFFLVDSVAIYGGFAGIEVSLDERDPLAHPTVLSGDLNDDDPDLTDNSFHVVVSVGNGPGAILDGFIISGGNAALAPGDDRGGGIAVFGGGPTLVNLRLQNNAAADRGGALHVDNGSASLIGCTFTDNLAGNAGGALSATLGNGVSVVNGLFFNNATAGGGGAIATSNAPLSLVNCSVAGNDVPLNGGGILFDGPGASGQIANSILWANTDGTGSDEAAQITVTGGSFFVDDSCVQGGWSGPGANNISTDPQFVGLAAGDLHVQNGSPTIDAANTPALPADDLDLDGDGIVSELLPLDLDGGPRILDDPSTPDTGVPGPSGNVADLGCYETFGGPSEDCNGNGVPDFIDIAMGTSTDCNLNSIPDECELDDCPPDVPPCDDCNNNGVLDECDIASGASEDLDMNGIPDECVEFTGLCGAAFPEWSCLENWNLDGIFPNNSEDQRYSVTLDLGDICVLDLDIQINTLRIIDSALLRVSLAEQADLEIAAPEGLLVESLLFVGSERRVVVSSGPIVLRKTGALYARDPESVKPSSATLDAAGVLIEPGAAVLLTEDMDIVCRGDYILNGAGIGAPCPTCGDKAPPVTDNPGNGSILIEGNLQLIGTAAWSYASNAALVLEGDFDNHSIAPKAFHFSQGAMWLNGDTEQHFEVGGIDVGASFDGFNPPIGPPDGPHSNFSMGTVQVVDDPATAVDVVFENTFANIVGDGPCDEALYVHTLTLGDDSTIRIDDCIVYYETLTLGSNTTVLLTGCGQLVPLPDCEEDSDCDDGSPCFADACVDGTCMFTQTLADCADLDSDTIRDDGCVWWSCSRATCTPTAIVYADMGGSNGACPPDGTADANDRFHALNCFSNTDTQGAAGYPCEYNPPSAYNVDAAGFRAPCDSDGVCDGNDAFAALNAFSGNTTCDCSAPAPHAPRRAGTVASARLRVVPRSERISPGAAVEVDIYLLTALADLRGYQLAIGVDGGIRGTLEVIDIAVGKLNGSPFAGMKPWHAFNVPAAQMVAGIDKRGVVVDAHTYLATVTLKTSDNARGAFVVDLRLPRSGRTFLFPTFENDAIDLVEVEPARIVVEPQRRTRAR